MATRFFKESDFSPLPKEDLPGIYLGISYQKKEIVDEGGVVFLRFIEKKRWRRVIHGNKFLLCTRLSLRDKFDNSVANIFSDMSMAGFYGDNPSLFQISSYNDVLHKNLSAKCNKSFRDFSKGFYPIDIDYLSELSEEKFPKDLDEMVSWDSGFQRCAGSENRWGMWILK